MLARLRATAPLTARVSWQGALVKGASPQSLMPPCPRPHHQLPPPVLTAADGAAATQICPRCSRATGCMAELSYASVMMPPTAELVWRVELAGTRNFSCRGGLEFGPALGVAEGELDGLECEWAAGCACAQDT